ncbi:MAG: hypothetical protein B7X90_13405 [Novosphingobium sp. 17-62-19]|nr:MAG: hypothetical protein B7X90_13405 [Novosphingobium sp. 17-62-19]
MLQRYPDVDANDIAEITRFLKEGLIVEVGFLITDEKLSYKVEHFRADHADKLGLSSRDYVIVTIIVAALVLACIFLWDASVT